MIPWIKNEVTEFSNVFWKFKQYKNSYIANFVYYRNFFSERKQTEIRWTNLPPA